MQKLNITNGLNNKNQLPTVIWTTTVEKNKKFQPEEITYWLEYAHTAASAMFKEILNPDFYVSLDR